ncbi:Cupin, RmlC-type [Metarhizium guizhouense ARSEF 977]|uniref:Cupin, RmlC-type n=1 Tax=Metarhizium guizhouense (strain ARSEF 977) TaxID=1276136 RepID=A0A0B4HW39_METGA|nr:Cupin, RmlC-type [Metarhizium guizhouense ARSEF 977]
MASFFPLISEILPMIMPAATHVTRAGDLEPKYPTVVEGPVTVRAAIVDKCDRMSATG